MKYSMFSTEFDNFLNYLEEKCVIHIDAISPISNDIALIQDWEGHDTYIIKLENGKLYMWNATDNLKEQPCVWNSIAEYKQQCEEESKEISGGTNAMTVFVLTSHYNDPCNGSDDETRVFGTYADAKKVFNAKVEDTIHNDSLFDNGKPADNTVVDDTSTDYWCAYEDGYAASNLVEFMLTEMEVE